MHMLMPRIVALCLAGVALGGIRPGAQRAAPPAADLLLVNGRIEAYTKGPAWASFEENVKGTLQPGRLADIAVFDTDLVQAGKASPARLLEAKVLYTIAGGRVVYEAK
jgi:predicted amidohydrolase YtcJ